MFSIRNDTFHCALQALLSWKSPHFSSKEHSPPPLKFGCVEAWSVVGAISCRRWSRAVYTLPVQLRPAPRQKLAQGILHSAKRTSPTQLISYANPPSAHCRWPALPARSLARSEHGKLCSAVCSVPFYSPPSFYKRRSFDERIEGRLHRNSTRSGSLYLYPTCVCTL